MKTFLVITLCLPAYVCCAQVVEHFTDGNFTTDPSWVGNTSHFVVNATQQLQLNNSVAGISYLATSYSAASINGFEWETFVRQTFSPSGSNFGRIYLVSDQSNLAGALNGYYLQLGEAGSNDAVELFRQAGTVHTSICRATNAAIASTFAIRVRVTRSIVGLWTLYVDYAGGASFMEEAHGTDAMFHSGNYFGVYCIYTASNANKFFFDDLLAGPPIGDITPPQLSGTMVSSQTEMLVEFSEPLDPASALTTNFLAGDSLGNPAAVNLLEDLKTMKLTFERPFLNGKSYDLHISGVRDLALNELAPVTTSFRYFVAEPPVPGDIVFNELFPDPSPVVGLPSQEFVEIYNKSDKAFDLNGWRLADLTSTAILPTRFILPGDYLIITTTSALESYKVHGATLALPDMPTLNNSGDTFVLRDPSGNTIDSIRYLLSWYQDEDKQQGGYTLERLSPDLETNEPLNWMASLNERGGTPGSPNSVLGRNPDSKPPAVDSLVVLDQHRLRLSFSEPIDSTSIHSPLAFVTGGGSVPAIVHCISDRFVEAEFETGFENGRNQQLLVNGIKDLAGNEIISLQLPFRFFEEGELSRGMVVINEIMADPAPTVHLPEAEFIEIVNVTDDPFSLKGWTLNDAAGVVAFPAEIILPREHVILTSSTNASKFYQLGRSIGVTGFPSLTNAGEPLVLKGPAGMMIDSVFFHSSWLGDAEKIDGGWSLERLNTSVNSNEPTNWRASIDTLGGTPGRPNSVAGMNPDVKPPLLDTVQVLSDHELALIFNEPLDSIIACDATRYSLDGQHPSEAGRSNAGAEILIRFTAPLLNGYEQQLLISGLRDLAGNEMAATSFSVMYFVPGQVGPHVILINEIMADPLPVIQLPEAEYVEVVNVSTLPYNLEGWTLSDANTSCILPGAIVHPGELLILTASPNVSKFTSMAHVVGVPCFPSLNNGGEPLVLRGPGGVVVDSVNYNVGWFAGGPGQDGGRSLERLRYNFASSADINWRASIDVRGGTPGMINSQFNKNPDDQCPRIVSAIAQSAVSIVVQFDEPVQPVPGEMVIRLDSVDCNELEWPSTREVHCALKDHLVNGVQYILSITGVKDTADNVMLPAQHSIRYFVPSEVNFKDIVINEIMADPSPTVGLPEIEYVELFNRSHNPIQMQGWSLSDNRSTGLLPEGILLPNDYLVVTTVHADPVQGHNWIEVAGAPSLNNEGEYLVIIAPGSIQIDSVNYNLDWYRENEKKDGGWSLELIDPLNPCGEEDNWAASEDESGGTPGRSNSILASKPDLTGPRVTGISVQSSRSVLVRFNEKLNESIGPGNFAISPGAGEIEVGFGDPSRRTILVSLENELLPSTPYDLNVSDLFDCNSNVLQEEFSLVQFTLPEDPLAGDIVINEVLFNPRPGGPDFLEIFNRGPRYVDMSGWKVVRADVESASSADGSINESKFLAPKTYRVFTTDSVRLQSDYPQSAAENIFQVPLPSMPDDKATVTIIDRHGKQLDSVAYDEHFHSALIRDPEGVSLERISMTASSFEPSNWRSAVESSGYATPGFLNSNSREDLDAPANHVVISPEVISLNGAENFTRIQYQFEEPGNFVNCRVYDVQGHLVKELANNMSVGYEGFLRWDGDRDDGGRARAGYYIVLLDYFNTSGEANTVRKRVAVAPR